MGIRLAPGQFLSTKLASRAVAGLLLAETAHPPDSRLPTHSHERACLCLILGGHVTETRERRRTTYEPSTLVYYPPGDCHANRFHERGGRSFMLELGDGWLERLGACSASIDEPRYFTTGDAPRLALRLYRERRMEDTASPLVVEGLVLELMGLASRRRVDDRGPDRLDRAKDFLHAHFAEPVGLMDTAAAAGMHPVFLAREFRRRVGRSVGEYVRELRVEFARAELAASEATVAEIATAAGFFDQSHFSRTFKRATGVTPAEYRRLIRPNDPRMR